MKQVYGFKTGYLILAIVKSSPEFDDAKVNLDTIYGMLALTTNSKNHHDILQTRELIFALIPFVFLAINVTKFNKK